MGEHVIACHDYRIKEHHGFSIVVDVGIKVQWKRLPLSLFNRVSTEPLQWGKQTDRCYRVSMEPMWWGEQKIVLIELVWNT